MESESPRVSLRSHVRVELVGKSHTREPLEFDIVPDREADFSKGLLSEDSPLARAILGQLEGASVSYRVGDLQQVTIVSIRAAEHDGAPDAAARREEALRQAQSQAELSDMISFALTFDSKWGDYDPEQIAAQWDEKNRKPQSDEREKEEK